MLQRIQNEIDLTPLSRMIKDNKRRIDEDFWAIENLKSRINRLRSNTCNQCQRAFLCYATEDIPMATWSVGGGGTQLTYGLGDAQILVTDNVGPTDIRSKELTGDCGILPVANPYCLPWYQNGIFTAMQIQTGGCEAYVIQQAPPVVYSSIATGDFAVGVHTFTISTPGGTRNISANVSEEMPQGTKVLLLHEGYSSTVGCAWNAIAHVGCAQVKWPFGIPDVGRFALGVTDGACTDEEITTCPTPAPEAKYEFDTLAELTAIDPTTLLSGTPGKVTQGPDFGNYLVQGPVGFNGTAWAKT